MKRFSLFLLLGFITLFSFAGDGEILDVPMTNDPANGHNRNEMVSPVVSYSQDTNELMVAFNSAESYTLQVTDAAGITQYSSPIVTNGNAYYYPVNLASLSLYLITIYSTHNTFVGVLFIP